MVSPMIALVFSAVISISDFLIVSDCVAVAASSPRAFSDLDLTCIVYAPISQPVVLRPYVPVLAPSVVTMAPSVLLSKTLPVPSVAA